MRPIKNRRPFRPGLERKREAAKPLVSLCVIFRNNAETIRALLDSVSGHFDEYVFTDTGCTDTTRQTIAGFLSNKLGKITEFPWCDDFAKARQANFDAATGQWRMFLDTDDVLQNGEKVRLLTSKLNTEHPSVKGVFLPLDYDIDEKLATMRLAKWDGHWSWQDAIHERLEWFDARGQMGLDQGSFARTSEMNVLHKRKTAEEKTAAIIRNAVIAQREYATATDAKYRSRLARTIAMEMKLKNLGEEALPYLAEVWEGYQNLAEGRQAASDAMKCHLVAGRLDEALVWARRAGPSYEALVHHARGEWTQCVDRQSRGFVIPQQTTHEGFIFEKAAAVVASADAALHLGLPVEGVERALNTVRADLREHPMFVAGTKRCRGEIDRISIVIPGTPQPFDTNSGGSMLGGSEEAVVYLSKALAQLGRNVRVWTPLPPTTVPGLDGDGVDWQDVSDFDYFDEHGTLVVWRSGGFALDLLSRVAKIEQNHGKEGVIPMTGIQGDSFWLHDQSIGLPPEQAFQVCKAFSNIVVLSDHHRRMILKTLGGKDPGNFVKLSNGIVGAQFEGLAEVEKDPNLICYTSCPSRGLGTLLEMWPRVKGACPDARLEICYDWSMLRDYQPDLYAKIKGQYESVRHLSVHHRGGVGHSELNTLFSQANVLAYAHFENVDVETSCLTVMKATAAGATVLCPPNGALPETAPDSDFVGSPSEYEATLIKLIQHPKPKSERVEKATKMLSRLSWENVAKQFSDVWTLQAKR